MPRHNTHRSDGNQKEIIERLRQLMVSAVPTSNVGEGVPDLMVGFRGKNYWYEVKDPNQPPSKQKLRPKQQKFFDTWGGHVKKVTTVEEILQDIGYIFHN